MTEHPRSIRKTLRNRFLHATPVAVIQVIGSISSICLCFPADLQSQTWTTPPASLWLLRCSLALLAFALGSWFYISVLNSRISEQEKELQDIKKFMSAEQHIAFLKAANDIS